MNERPARNFLQALRRMSRQVSLYPEGHPLTKEASELLHATVGELIGPNPEAVLAITSDSVYLNRALLPHTSLEHNGLLHEMHNRNLESVTLINPVSPADLYDLAAFISAASDDLPAEGTVRFNEQPYRETLLDDSAMSALRRSYTGGLDALRAASYSMASEGAFDLGRVVTAVETLLGPSLENSSATLLLSTVKSHDEYTFYHSLNVCILSIALGRLLGLADSELVLIGAGAALHDIGKTGVPPSILNHPGRLSAEQWREMKIHPQEGASAIMAAGGIAHEVSATIALEHHARFDGSGYPTSHHPHRPHAFSSLVTAVDVYDSITTRRPYRRAGTPSQALAALIDGAGSHFDPDMVRAMVELMGIYPPGSLLRLDTGEIAMVTTHPAGDFETLEAVIARTASGELIEPEPLLLPIERVAAQLLPTEAGIDPAALLQKEAVELQVFT